MYMHIYQDGYTALIRASAKGHREVVQLLLEHGADTKQLDNVSHTPLPLPLPSLSISNPCSNNHCYKGSIR